MSEADPETSLTDGGGDGEDDDEWRTPPPGGRPVEFPDEDFLAAVRDLEAAEGGGTTDEVADRVGCAERTALARLTELAEEGAVTSRRVGRQHLWRLDDGTQED